MSQWDIQSGDNFTADRLNRAIREAVQEAISQIGGPNIIRSQHGLWIGEQSKRNVFIVRPQRPSGIPGLTPNISCSSRYCCWQDLARISIGGAGAIVNGTVNDRSKFVSQNLVFAWNYTLSWNGTTWVLMDTDGNTYIGPDGDCPLGEYVGDEYSDVAGETICVTQYCPDDGGECQTDEEVLCVDVDGVTATANGTLNGATKYRYDNPGGGGFTVSWNGTNWQVAIDGGSSWLGGINKLCPFGFYEEDPCDPTAGICVARHKTEAGMPGSAICDVYYLTPNSCGNSLVDSGRDEVVFNLSQDPMPQDYLLAVQENWNRLIATSIAGTPTVQMIRFRVVAAGPFLGSDAVECDSVIGCVLDVSCLATGVTVGDEVTIWDPSRCHFNIPIEVLVGAVGSAIQMTNNSQGADCTEAGLDAGACRWVITGGLCCTEDIYYP